MEIFKNVSYDWLGKKWYFVAGSMIMLLIGVGAYFVRGGLAYGIDFTGGTLIIMKFNQPPDLDKIRNALNPEAVTPPLIQTFDDPSKNTVQIRVQRFKSGADDVEAGQKAIQNRLRQVFDPGNAGGTQLDIRIVFGICALIESSMKVFLHRYRIHRIDTMRFLLKNFKLSFAKVERRFIISIKVMDLLFSN